MPSDPQTSGLLGLFDVFDDLEQQAEGLHLVERDAEVAQLSVSEYAEVDLASRLHASAGTALSLVLTGGYVVEGAVGPVGRDWLVVVSGRSETVVRTAAISRVRGVSARAVPDAARRPGARLGVGSPLRRMAAARDRLTLVLTDGSALTGTVQRVGADFVEVLTDAERGGTELVPFAQLLCVRR